MDERSFWELVDRLDGAADEESVTSLVAALARLPEGEITGFEDHLARALHALDTPAHYSVFGVGDDSFLYCRCAVVAAGREEYARVLADPAQLAGFVDGEGELLLDAARQAYEQVTGLLWEHEPPVSYETGANARAWGRSPAAPGDGEPDERWWAWLSVGSGYDEDVPGRPAYDFVEYELTKAIDADPAWQRWWAASGVPDLQLWPFYSRSETPSAQVKRGRKRIEGHFTLDGTVFMTVDRDVLRHRAVDDVRRMLDAVGRELGLGPLPGFPQIPELPDDLPDALIAED